MQIHICHKCNIVYEEKRPFVCIECSANVFIKGYDASKSEVEEMKVNNKEFTFKKPANFEGMKL